MVLNIATGIPQTPQTVVPLYMATLISGHPSYAARILGNKPFINVINVYN